MIQFYTKTASNLGMQPKKETIKFLLDFSKSYKVVKPKEPDVFIELSLN